MSNSIAESAEACRLAKLLIEKEARRIGNRKLAHQRVARTIGISPGTLENITRERLNRIAGWVLDALRARVVHELEAEIVRLRHELAVLKHLGAASSDDQVAANHADLSAILAALGQTRR